MGELKDCFEFSKDKRPKKILAGYFGDELEIRTTGVEAATKYISMQIPNKTGSFTSMMAAFAIGVGVGIIVMRYFSIIPM
jgi:hypothetical protein